MRFYLGMEDTHQHHHSETDEKQSEGSWHLKHIIITFAFNNTDYTRTSRQVKKQRTIGLHCNFWCRTLSNYAQYHSVGRDLAGISSHPSTPLVMLVFCEHKDQNFDAITGVSAPRDSQPVTLINQSKSFLACTCSVKLL